MSYIYLGAAVQLLLILSALRVTAVQALQATQSKQTSDALRRARARRASTARGNFVDLVSARSSLFDVAASIAEAYVFVGVARAIERCEEKICGDVVAAVLEDCGGALRCRWRTLRSSSERSSRRREPE